MTDDKNELQHSLDALEGEVAKLRGVDEPTRERLAVLVDSLGRQVADPDDSDHKDSLLERIPQLIEHFEVEHPRLTATLNRIVMALSDMGI